uniref:Uncharacterized protein n=1 Tax=Crocodylus porosus TaxID=8502 RepID=A0A7M4G217_CROPO
MSYLADLNIKLQGKDQFVSRLHEHIQSFIHKLELFQKQLNKKNVTHFTILLARWAETVNHDKYSALIGRLLDEFKQRFADFRKHRDELKLFANPFGTDATDAPDTFQMELTDIQNNGALKRAFAEHNLLTFYSQYNIKTKSRSLLTDGHLSGILRIATSSLLADIDNLCKQKQGQVSQ